MTAHRFPPPCSAEETDACFIVKDSAGQKLGSISRKSPAGESLAESPELASGLPTFCLY
jgi:hypothetical protein